MKTSLGKRVVASWAAVVLASFVMAPVAEAQRRGGGGGGAVSGRAGASGIVFNQPNVLEAEATFVSAKVLLRGALSLPAPGPGRRSGS